MGALPIRLRLTLVFALAMAVVLAAVGFFLYQRVGSASRDTVDEGLHGQTAETLARIDSRGVSDDDLVDKDARTGATVAELLDRRGQVVVSSPPGLAAFLSPADARAVLTGRPVLRTTHIPGFDHEWRLLAEPTRDHGHVLVAARSLEASDEALHGLFREFLIVGPLALLLASLAGYGLAAAALRPVESMRRRASSVSPRLPGQRLPVPRSRDEVSRLAETLNEMLDRLEAAFAHERRFVADASHELRTPLALLRTELDLALRRPRPRAELEAALRSAAEDTERLSRLAEDLLLLAGGDQGGLPTRPEAVAVGALLERVRSRFAARAAQEGRVVAAEPTGLVADADPDRLEQALGNLIDNALRHGGGAVRLSARAARNRIELHVEDEGDGFPEAFLARAFDRFSRADEARGSGGIGLGLSIVDLIASAHGGAAGIANRPGGGADVWIAVPAEVASSGRESQAAPAETVAPA